MIGLRALVELTILTFLVATVPAACTGDSSGGKTVPVHTGWVNDNANILTKSDQEHLSDMLRNYQDETHHQIAVLTVTSLEGEPIGSFSLRTANTWGLGLKGIDNGILVTLAMKERMVRIELGKGMENFISHSDAEVIIDTEMAPAFAKGNFSQGLELGLRRLMDQARRFVVKPDAATLITGWNLMAACNRLEQPVTSPVSSGEHRMIGI
jgi:uncharacterized membrane protein YgcG